MGCRLDSRFPNHTASKPNTTMLCLWVFLTLSGLVQRTLGSPGDWLDEFIDCKELCEASIPCAGFEGIEIPSGASAEITYFTEASAIQKYFLFWDCKSNCDYQCQQVVTQIRIAEGEKVVQFHGKWPFKRLFGMQELFSTLFSVANFFPHYRGYKLLQRELSRLPARKRSRFILKKYLYVAIAGMLAWTSSSIFHFRDLEVTEKLDYFFAGATVLSGFHGILIRILRLDKSDQFRHAVTAAVLLIFSLHVLRLYLDWSYTYNMRFNVLFGLLQYILLLTLAYKNYRQLKAGKLPRKSHHLPRENLYFELCVVPVALVVGTALAMSCELFDFFSYSWQIDSHAIWHACTVLPSWKLYDFFLHDFHYLDACEDSSSD